MIFSVHQSTNRNSSVRTRYNSDEREKLTSYLNLVLVERIEFKQTNKIQACFPVVHETVNAIFNVAYPYSFTLFPGH